MADQNDAPPVKKRKYTKRKNVAKDGGDARGAKGNDAFDVLTYQLAVDEKQTEALMADVAARRLLRKDSQDSQSSSPYPQLQLLSEWRLFQEIARQQRPDAGARVSLSSIRGDAADGSKKLLGFDPELLDVLQLGATSHLRDILVGASRMAKQRRHGSQKQAGFTIVEDVRIGLGDIRKRDEDEAARIRDMENELTLKQAAHKSADDELREKAKNLKERRAGEQAQEAANKALAATLGGGKWDKWGIGGSTLKTTPKAGDVLGAAEPGKDAAGAGAALRGQLQGGVVIEIGDIVAFLETQPEYANSPILFKLMNLKSMM